jgi:hypothetical protein
MNQVPPLRVGLLIVLACASAGLAACQARTVMEQPSPNGEMTAVVVDLPVLDGPANVLYVRGPGRKMRELAKLPEDNEGCVGIVWSGNGQRVGFVSRGTDGMYLRVFEPTSGSLLAKQRLTPQGVEADRVQLGAQAVSVQFRECQSPGKQCVDRSLDLRRDR